MSGLGACGRCFGKQFASDAEVRERRDFIAVPLEISDDGVDPVVEGLVDTPRPDRSS